MITYENLANFLEGEKDKVNSLNDLSSVITKFINKANKKVVLFIKTDGRLFIYFS
jgi:hypothetical protein